MAVKIDQAVTKWVQTSRVIALVLAVYQYLIPSCLRSCGFKTFCFFLKIKLYLLTFITFVNICWEKSLFKVMIRHLNNQTGHLVRSFDRLTIPVWKSVIEASLLLLIIFMPVLNSWVLIIPLLVLFFLAQQGRSHSWSRELFIFWIILVLSAVFSPGFKVGIKSLTTYSTWIVMAWMMGATFYEAFIQRATHFLVISSLPWIIMGFKQLWAGVPTPPSWVGNEQSSTITLRIYSLFGNPNVYALYLLCILVLANHLIAKTERLWVKLFYFFILTLVLTSLYFTYSRFAWLLAGIYLTVYYWRKWGNKGWLIIIGILTLFCFTMEGIKVRFLSLILWRDSSVLYRLRIWQGVVRALPDYWLWGTGPAGFTTVYPLYQLGNTVAEHAHQLFLQFWFEHGLLSLVAFLLFGLKMLAGYKNYNETAKALAVIILMFLLYGFSETWYTQRFLGGYFWLLGGLLLALQGKKELKAE